MCSLPAVIVSPLPSPTFTFRRLIQRLTIALSRRIWGSLFQNPILSPSLNSAFPRVVVPVTSPHGLSRHYRRGTLSSSPKRRNLNPERDISQQKLVMPRGGGGGRRGRGGREMSRDEQISRVLSRLLRHNAISEGLEVRSGGWVKLEDVLSSRHVKPLKLTFPEILTQIQTSDKQRFALKPIPQPSESSTEAPDNQSLAATEIDPSSDANDYLIRATQGHSITFPLEDLITPLTPETAPRLVVHGTSHAAWKRILSSGGLKPMGRNHVHFARGLPAGFKEVADDAAAKPAGEEGQTQGERSETTQLGGKLVEEEAPPVISGMRNSSSVLIYLDVQKAMAAGVKFGLSENGVVLSEGDTEHLVRVEFFRKVEDRTQGKGTVVMRDGVLIDRKP